MVDGKVFMDYDMSILTESEHKNPPKKDCSKTCIRSQSLATRGTLLPPHIFKGTEYGQIEEHVTAKEILEELFSGKKKPERPHDCDLYHSSRTRKDLTDTGEDKYRHVGYRPDWKSRNHYLLICEQIYRKFEKLEWVKLDFVKSLDQVQNINQLSDGEVQFVVVENADYELKIESFDDREPGEELKSLEKRRHSTTKVTSVKRYTVVYGGV